TLCYAAFDEKARFPSAGRSSAHCSSGSHSVPAGRPREEKKSAARFRFFKPYSSHASRAVRRDGEAIMHPYRPTFQRLFATEIHTPASKSVAVLGAGHGGLALAGDLALRGFRVHLWNRSAGPLAKVRSEGGIRLSHGA